MPIDASIPLGAKAPDSMQQLSSMLNAAGNAQSYQNNNISLNERKAVQGVLSDPKNYTDEQGNIDFNRALPQIMQAAPTTGSKYVQDLMTAQQQQTEAKRSLNAMTTENRTQMGQVLRSLPDNASPELVNKTLDQFEGLYKGSGPYVGYLRNTFSNAAKAGQLPDVIFHAANATLPQQTQQEMNTPAVANVDNGQQIEGINLKPGVANVPQGAKVFSVQKQLPPTTPTVSPVTNQPGYVGPQPISTPPIASPKPGGKMYPTEASMSGAATTGMGSSAEDYDREIDQSTRDLQYLKDPASRQSLQAHIDEMKRQKAAYTGGGFVPSAAAPGANESKAGSVQVVNDHWAHINAGAADAPVAQSLLSTIKQLAPGAITGTEAGKKAYWNGLFNALHLGTEATGDVQKDTDLLTKSMAQLNLATPATTDAMRTLIEAGRPHSTMSKDAIIEAAGQIEGQIKANMALRNLLSQDKQYASATGDTSHYEQKRQTLEPLMDPRIFQYEGLSKDERKAFMGRMKPADRATLIEKTKKLEALGVFQ